MLWKRFPEPFCLVADYLSTRTGTPSEGSHNRRTSLGFPGDLIRPSRGSGGRLQDADRQGPIARHTMGHL